MNAIDKIGESESAFEMICYLMVVVFLTLFGVLFCWTNMGYNTLWDLWVDGR